MADAFYNSAAWKRVRADRLFANPLCSPCSERGLVKVATVVDHTVDRRTAPDRALDLTNLVSMCVPCHSIKTARGPEAGAVKTMRSVQPRKGCDANGNPIDPTHPWNQEGGRVRPSKAVGSQTASPISTQLVSKSD